MQKVQLLIRILLLIIKDNVMQMKSFFQCGLLISTFVGLASCGSSENYTLAVNSWQGAPKTALVHQWGEPEQESRLANGHQLYTYRVVEHEEPVSRTYSSTIGTTARMSPQGETSLLSASPMIKRNREETFWCETQFEINDAGMIVNTHFEGNNCTITQHNAERWAFAR